MEELGRKLKEARESKGLSIAELSELTKIREHYIEDIERGDISTVSPVYAKSFIISFAKAVDLPQEDYVAEMNSIISKARATRPKQLPKHDESIKNSIKGSDRRLVDSLRPDNLRSAFTQENIKKTLVVLIGLLGLIVVYIVYFDVGSENVADPVLTNGTIVSDTTFIDVDLDEESEDEGILGGMFSSGQDSIILTANAIDSSWVKVVIDGKRVDEKLIVPGEKITWKAKEYFLMTQGNVGALEIRRNGKLLEPFGAKGTVVKSVKITEKEVKVP